MICVDRGLTSSCVLVQGRYIYYCYALMANLTHTLTLYIEYLPNNYNDQQIIYAHKTQSNRAVFLLLIGVVTDLESF